MHKKWSFTLKISSASEPDSQFPADLVTFNEEIFNGELIFSAVDVVISKSFSCLQLKIINHIFLNQN